MPERVQKNARKPYLVNCVANPHGKRKPMEMETETDAVYYYDFLDNEIILLKLTKVKQSW